MWLLLYFFLRLFSSDSFTVCTCLQPYKFFNWIYGFFKNHPWRRVFHTTNLNNLENILQRSLRTDRAREKLFRASGSTNLENLLSDADHGGTFVGLMYICIGLPKKALDMSLVKISLVINSWDFQVIGTY